MKVFSLLMSSSWGEETNLKVHLARKVLGKESLTVIWKVSQYVASIKWHFRQEKETQDKWDGAEATSYTCLLRYIRNREIKSSSSTNFTIVNWITYSDFNPHTHKNLFSSYTLLSLWTMNNGSHSVVRKSSHSTWQVIKYHPVPASLFDPVSLGRLTWLVYSLASYKFTGG